MGKFIESLLAHVARVVARIRPSPDIDIGRSAQPHRPVATTANSTWRQAAWVCMVITGIVASSITFIIVELHQLESIGAAVLVGAVLPVLAMVLVAFMLIAIAPTMAFGDNTCSRWQVLDRAHPLTHFSRPAASNSTRRTGAEDGALGIQHRHPMLD
jgi:hypothetical protein